MDIKNKILIHKKKVIVLSIILVVAVFVIYKVAAKETVQVKYTVATVQKTTIIDSVSGTGQVSTLNKLELKPLSSGVVVNIPVKQGDKVKSGQTLLVLDQRSAGISVNQAKASYDSAKANYDKVVGGPTQSDLLSYQNAITNAQSDLEKTKVDQANTIYNAEQAVETAKNNLKLSEGGENSKIVQDAYNTMFTLLQTTQNNLSNSLLAADAILGIDNPFTNSDFKNVLSLLNSSALNIANTNYGVAKEDKNNYDQSLSVLNLTSSHQDIDSVTSKAQKSLFSMKELLLSISIVFDNTRPIGNLTQAELDSMIADISSSRSSIISSITSLLNQIKAIDDAKNSYNTYQIAYQKSLNDLNKTKTDAEITIKQKELALQQAKDNLAAKQSITPVDIQSAKSQLVSAESQLQTAYNNYSNTILKAPFDGVVAAISAVKGDQVGSGTAAITLITEQQIATISMNEVDIAKVKVGQKATLTFDAISDLTIAGQVAQVDTIGTVSQGVVSYNVQVNFDTQDERVKPGMSTNVSIILSVKADVLAVPNSAVKNKNGQNYVEVLDSAQTSPADENGKYLISKTMPEQKNVEVGISNDSYTEIISGLNEGESFVSQTINSSSGSSGSKTTQSSNNIRIPGLTGSTGGGGGNFRP